MSKIIDTPKCTDAELIFRAMQLVLLVNDKNDGTLLRSHEFIRVNELLNRYCGIVVENVDRFSSKDHPIRVLENMVFNLNHLLVTFSNSYDKEVKTAAGYLISQIDLFDCSIELLGVQKFIANVISNLWILERTKNKKYVDVLSIKGNISYVKSYLIDLINGECVVKISKFSSAELVIMNSYRKSLEVNLNLLNTLLETEGFLEE